MGAIATTRAQAIYHYDSDVQGDINLSTNPFAIPIKGDNYDYFPVMVAPISSVAKGISSRLNSDATTNYRAYYMKGQNSSKVANTNDSSSALTYRSQQTHRPLLFLGSLLGASGNERFWDYLVGTTDSNGNTDIQKGAGYWKNTGDEATELSVYSTTSSAEPLDFMLFATPKDSAQEEWELISTKTWAASAATQVFTGLNGDVDGQYKIRWDGGTFCDIEIDGDLGPNYIEQFLRNNAATIQAANPTQNRIGPAVFNGEFLINAVSGKKRLITTSGAKTVAAQQEERAYWWSNTADIIGTIEITPNASTDATAHLYRKRTPNKTSDTLPWQTVKEVPISGDFSAGYLFDNLTGDSEFLYKVEFLGEPITASLLHRFNSDVGSNYPLQWLEASASTVSAGSSTETYIPLTQANVANVPVHGSSIIYPKSGQQRPALIETFSRENLIYKFAGWYDNTGDEITSILIYASNTDAVEGTLRLSKIPRIQP